MRCLNAVHSALTYFLNLPLSKHTVENDSFLAVEEGAYILVVTGCPMLLAVMCVERYAAVARPLVYLRARKWGYKIATTAAVWTVTLIFVMTTGEDVYGSHTRDAVGSDIE